MANDIFPPNYGTAVGKVRALIPDVDQPDWEGDGSTSYLFTDSHLNALITLYPDDGEGNFTRGQIRRAAADAVEAIAVSEALISKVIKTEDLQTDGAKVANALVARAAQLRRQADDDDEVDMATTAFTIVEFHPERPVPLQDWNVRIAAWRELF